MRLFEKEGTFRRAIGQQGEGPGDMQGARRLLPAGGDTLLLFDWRLMRLTAFDTGGQVRYLRTVELGPTHESNGHRSIARADVLGRLTGGDLLGATGPMRINPQTGHYADPRELWRIDSTGSLDSLAVLPGGHSWVYEFPNRSVWFDSTAFAPRASTALTPTQWWWTGGADFEVRELGADARPVRFMRAARRHLPVDQAARDRIRAREIAIVDDAYKGDVETIYDWLTWPDSMPAYDQLAVDELDHVWARVFPDTASTATWDLFAPDGTLLGTVAVPADLTVRQIGADWLLATRKGELDEPLVVLYRLTRHR